MSQGLACRRCRKYILPTESWGFHEGCANEEFTMFLQEIQSLRSRVKELEEAVEWALDECGLNNKSGVIYRMVPQEELRRRAGKED